MSWFRTFKKKRVPQPQQHEMNDALLQPADSEDSKRYEEYLDRLDQFKQLPVKQQLNRLASDTEACDKVIGKIYVQNPPAFDEKEKLNKLLGDALLIEEYAVMGQGDSEFHLLFAVGQLLIGVKYFAYWGNPLSMVDGCDVYRFSKDKTIADLDLKEIKKAVLGY